MRIRGKLIFRDKSGKEKIINYSGSEEFINEVLTIVDLHSRKNADYSAAENPYSTFIVVEDIGIPAHMGVFVRMSDKWERIKNLLAKGEENRAVKEESLIDTARDLAVYSLIFVSLLKRKEEKQEKKIGTELIMPLEELKMENYMVG